MNVLPDSIDFESFYQEHEPLNHLRSAKDAIYDLKLELQKKIAHKPITMPWSKTLGEFEFRPQEVTVYAGQNGSGKSMMTGQIALNLIQQGEKVCIASFEMRPVRSIQRMIRQFSHMTDPTSDQFERFEQWVGESMWFYDHQGAADPRAVIGVGRYVSKHFGVKHFFVDSLMKCVRAEDDYNGQKAFIDDLTALARYEDMHIHLVHHIRKGQSDDALPDKVSLKGSGSIADQVDNVFLFYRNKKKERAIQSGLLVDPSEYDALLMCEKQRNGEHESYYALWYHRASQQFVESSHGQPTSFV